MKRFAAFLILLQVSQHALGVEVFDDVEFAQLPCRVSISTSSNSTVVWSREDLKFSTLHVRQPSGDDLEEQNPLYRGRTQMRTDALQTGDLDLLLKKPVVSDSENYTCIVRRFGKELSRISVLLKVQERPPLWPTVVLPVLALLLILAAGVGLIIYRRFKTIKHNPVYKLQLEKAVEGQESVLLPCKTKTRLPKDATVEWRRIDTDMVVHVYPPSQNPLHAQHETYQGSTEMTESPLTTGDLSLTLLSPHHSDSGLYVCTVQKDGCNLKQKIVSLSVKERSVPDGVPGFSCQHEMIYNWIYNSSSGRNSLRLSLKSSVGQAVQPQRSYASSCAYESNSGPRSSIREYIGDGVFITLVSGVTGSAVSLTISPDQQQFFSGQSVSLSCVFEGQNPGWTIRRSRGGQTKECGAAGSGFGVLSESSCDLDLLSSYTGAYWCETSSGQRSEQINITVAHKEGSALILEIPALPVSTGSDITLRCRNKFGTIHAAYFYRNEEIVGNAIKTQNMVIHGVQQSDEGFFSCSTDRSGSSPQSFLRVRDPPPPHTITTPTPPPSAGTGPPDNSPPPLPSLHLLCHLLVICPYCVCSILLMSICCRANSGIQPAISKETTQPDEGCDDVTTEHDF